MLRLHYFASVREQLGASSETVDLPPGVNDVAGLANWLAQRGQSWTLLLDTAQVLVAVNQEIVPRSCCLQGDEEVAFFPPMTGG